MTTTVQAQFVLYNTPLEDINRSVISFAYGAKRSGISLKIAVGDASKDSLSSEEIRTLKDTARDYGCELSYTFFNENTGYGKGHNQLAKDSDAQILIFSNPDILITSYFFEAIISTFEEDRTIGIVDPRQTPVEHPKDYSLETLDTDWASGACMAIRSSLFKKIGGFDSDTFWMYCEDVDISWRVKAEGYRVIYQPSAIVYHPKHLSDEARWSPTQTEVFYSCQTALLLAYKWKNDARLKKIISAYTNGCDVEQEALRAFRHKVQTGSIKQVEDELAKYATFYVEGTYSPHRFEL